MWWRYSLLCILTYEAMKIWALLDANAAFTGLTSEAEASEPIAQVACETFCPIPQGSAGVPGTTKVLPGPIFGWYTVNDDGSVTRCRMVAR